MKEQCDDIAEENAASSIATDSDDDDGGYSADEDVSYDRSMDILEKNYLDGLTVITGADINTDLLLHNRHEFENIARDESTKTHFLKIISILFKYRTDSGTN